MKLSLSWLASYFTDKPDFDVIFDKLTMAGIEVESITPVAPYFSSVVVAEVIECVPHPDADKLSLCKVHVGNNEITQIVCGAKNVKTGVKVPCALVGGELPNDFKIDKRTMRGIDSFGMLCSADELGIDGYDNEGLLILDESAPVGECIRKYLDLDDKIVELKITPNRSDCLSINGILREIRALTDYTINVNDYTLINVSPSMTGSITIDNQAQVACPNYYALTIQNIDNSVVLPDFITKRIRASGMRTISAVVDIINYVMLEIGQPMHAFDLNKIAKQQLVIRYANDNEELKLLDGKTARLNSNTLLIADGEANPLAIAGVMGGLDSGVTETTTSIVLESAFFTPDVIMGKTKQYGVSSDSAYRFERGVDTKLQQYAIFYVADLIKKYCGGEFVGFQSLITTSAYGEVIEVGFNEINTKIGQVISNTQQLDILTKLGFSYEVNGEVISVKAPSFRFDIKIREDIIEEIARVYGYNNIIPIMPKSESIIRPIDVTRELTSMYKQKLQTFGYSEIISYAFIEEAYEEMLGNKDANVVKLLNSIAGLGVMRTSLIADLIKALVSNINRGHKSVRIFELARVFWGEDDTSQPLKLSGLAYGNRAPTNWCNGNTAVDFFDVKQDILNLLSNVSGIEFHPLIDSALLHSGRAASIKVDGIEIGFMGQLHPRLSQKLDVVGNAPYIFELDFDRLAVCQNMVKFREVSKFQKVERDLSLVLHQTQNVGEILLAIKALDVPYLIDVEVFDVYLGSNLDKEQKSVGLSFIFQGFKTLVDDEVNKSMNMIIDLVTNKFFAILRK